MEHVSARNLPIFVRNIDEKPICCIIEAVAVEIECHVFQLTVNTTSRWVEHVAMRPWWRVEFTTSAGSLTREVRACAVTPGSSDL